jgi:hypothetical protein
MADLRRLRTLAFSARSGKATGWNGQGQGEVSTETPSPDVILFREAGHWHPTGREANPPLQFRNIYRWTLANDQTVRLEHLRLGPEQPVFLLDLVPASPQEWTCAEPHQCSADRYSLRVVAQRDGLQMYWSITGPKKDEHMAYVYRFGDKS